MGTKVLVEGLGQLVDRGRDLQAVEKHTLLPLHADVLGPSDEAGEITLGLDVLTDAEVLGPLLEQSGGRTLVGLLGGLGGHSLLAALDGGLGVLVVGGSRHHLSASLLGLLRHGGYGRTIEEEKEKRKDFFAALPIHISLA